MHSEVKGRKFTITSITASYVVEPWIPLVPWLPEVAQGRRCSNPAIDIVWSIYKFSFIQVFSFVILLCPMLQVLLLALLQQFRHVEPIQVRRKLVERAPVQVAPFGLGLNDLVVVNDAHKVLT